MIYVGRVVESVGEGELAKDWYTIERLEELGQNKIYPNVLQLLKDVRSYLTRRRPSPK